MTIPMLPRVTLTPAVMLCRCMMKMGDLVVAQFDVGPKKLGIDNAK